MSSEPDEAQRRVAVVTGGSHGIGLETAALLAGSGHHVAIWDTRSPESPDTFFHCVTDVSSREQVDNALRATVEALGPVRVLVNNAGITFGFLPVDTMDERHWQRILNVNLTGAMECTRAVVPVMTQAGGGAIVNVGSIMATFGYPGQSAYAASKGALASLTRTWARELGPAGIRVNLIVPGYIDTRMNAANGPQLEQMVRERTPLGRLGKARDVAAAIAFMVSDAATFINGAELAVDGGFIP